MGFGRGFFRFQFSPQLAVREFGKLRLFLLQVRKQPVQFNASLVELPLGPRNQRRSDAVDFRHFKRERGARLSNLKFVLGGKGFTVEEHASVECLGKFCGACLDVGVVGRDDAKRPFVVQVLKKNLGQRPAQLGVGPRSKLVQKQQRLCIRNRQEVAHSSKPVAVCGELIFNALVVSDVGKDGVEDANFRGVVARNQQAALCHELKQPNRFHGDAFATRVGAADDEHALPAVQLHVLRQGFLSCVAICLLKQGVVGGEEVKPGLLPNLRQAAFHAHGQTRTRRDPVEFGQCPLVALDFRQMPANVPREHPQDVPDFLALVVAEHFQLVVEGDARSWFDERHRTGVGASEDGACHLAFVAADDGQRASFLHEAFTDVGELPFLLKVLHGAQKRPVDFAPYRGHFFANSLQFGRGVVANVTFGVKHGVDRLDEFGVGGLAFDHGLHAWPREVGSGQHLQHLVHDAAGRGNATEPCFVQHAVPHSQHLDFAVELFKFQKREPRSCLAQALHFVGFVKPFNHPRPVFARNQRGCAVFACGAAREPCQQVANDVKFQVLAGLVVEMVKQCAGFHACSVLVASGRGVPCSLWTSPQTWARQAFIASWDVRSPKSNHVVPTSR